MAADKNSVIWGVKQLFIRPGDGNEYQLEAAQEAQVSAKATIAKLMGDDALVALDTQAKSKDLSIAFKNGKLSAAVVQLMVGGTNVSNGAGTLTSPLQESVDASIKTALSASVVSAAALVSDTYSFLAASTTQYYIVPSSTGVAAGPFAASSYPNTTAIPGVSFTVNGALVQGSAASITTVGPTDTVQLGTEAKNDFASKVGVRVITEAPSATKGQVAGQWEMLFPVCQSEGLEFPLKTKDYAIVSGNFTPIYDPNVGYIVSTRKYSRQS